MSDSAKDHVECRIDTTRVHTRIDILGSKFEKSHTALLAKLNEIITDVKVMKKTCETRKVTCAAHVEDMDKTLRGNGQEGVVARLGAVEKQGTGREKFAYLVIGVLITSVVSLALAMVTQLMTN